jgi:hypothetical protein
MAAETAALDLPPDKLVAMVALELWEGSAAT